MTKLTGVCDRGQTYVKLEADLPEGRVELVTFCKQFATVNDVPISNAEIWEAVKRWRKFLAEQRSQFAGQNCWTINIIETEVFRCSAESGVTAYGEQVGTVEDAVAFFPKA